MEPYLGDATGRRRDWQGSGASSHHEINTIANGSYQYYFFLCTPRVIGKRPNPLGARILTLVYLPLHYVKSLAISHLLHLHIRAALFLCIRQSSHSITTTTSGSIGASSIDISPVGEHLEKRTSGPIDVYIVCGVKSKLFSLKTIRRKQASLD